MTTAELKESLGMIADLERDYYALGKIEDSLYKKIENFYIAPVEKTFEIYCRNRGYDTKIPQFSEIEKPPKPQEPKRADFNSENPYTLERFLVLIIAGIVFLPCIFILPLVWTHKKNEAAEKAYEAAMKEYYERKASYDKNLENQVQYRKKKKVHDEHYEKWQKEQENYKTLSACSKAKSEPLRLMLRKILQQKQNTYTVLREMYTTCNIYSKYQNLAAICSFYDYIAAGICTRLEGNDGAYNKYDIEMRMDRMLTKLDVIVDNLEIIRDNQNKLYSELCNVSRKINQLQSSLNRIENQLQQIILDVSAIYEQGSRQNVQLSMLREQTEKILETSELNKYLNECNQRELHYMNRMNYLAGHYDNPYGNYAPV